MWPCLFQSKRKNLFLYPLESGWALGLLSPIEFCGKDTMTVLLSLNWPASFYFLLLRMFTWGKLRSHIISPIITSYKEAWATHIKRLCGEMPSYMSNLVGPSDDSRPCSHLTTTAYTENCFTEPSQPTEWWDIMKNHLILLGSGLVYQMATDTWNGGRKKNREWFRAIIALLHININWTFHSELRDLY